MDVIEPKVTIGAMLGAQGAIFYEKIDEHLEFIGCDSCTIAGQGATDIEAMMDLGDSLTSLHIYYGFMEKSEFNDMIAKIDDAISKTIELPSNE